MKSFKVLAAIGAASLALFSGSAISAQALTKDKSSVAFTFKQMGVSVDGQFKKFDAQLALDPAKWEKSTVSFTVDTSSVSLGARETDSEVVKPEWLSTTKFPTATFVSSSVRASGVGKLEVAGKLTIKGVSTNVSFPVALAQSGPLTVATGTLPIQRLVYKVGEGDWADVSMVADSVTVKFKLALTGLPKFDAPAVPAGF